MQVQKDDEYSYSLYIRPKSGSRIASTCKRQKGEYPWEPLGVPPCVLSDCPPPSTLCSPAHLLLLVTQRIPAQCFFHLALLVLKTLSRSFCCAHTSNPSYPLCCLPFPKGNTPGWRQVCLSSTAGPARMCHRVQWHLWNLVKDADNSAACRIWSIPISVFREGVWLYIFLQKTSLFYHYFSQVSCMP